MTYVRLVRTNKAQSQDFGLRSEVRALSLLLDLAWRRWERLAVAPGSWRIEPPQTKQEGASDPREIVLVLNPLMPEARSIHDVTHALFKPVWVLSHFNERGWPIQAQSSS